MLSLLWSALGDHITHPYSTVSSTSVLSIGPLILSRPQTIVEPHAVCSEAFDGKVNAALVFDHKVSMLGNSISKVDRLVGLNMFLVRCRVQLGHGHRLRLFFFQAPNAAHTR